MQCFFVNKLLTGCKKAVLTTRNRHFDQAKQAFPQRKKATVPRFVRLFSAATLSKACNSPIPKGKKETATHFRKKVHG